MRLRRSKGSSAPAHDAIASPADAAGRWTVAQQVSQFMVAGLVAVVIVGFATAIASRRIGEREAIVDARTTALVRAQGVVEPAVTDGLLTRQPAAVAKIANVVESAVIDESLVRVKIWNRAGMVVYSDEPRLDGLTYQLGADEIAAIDQGRIEAEVSDLAKPENRFERSQKKLLEVYLPIRAPNGQRLLFEAYFRYGAVSAAGARIWRSFAPISLGALIVLELIQVPFAWSLARRLRQRQREREALLRQALDASDLERRRIAADLHDGVVQDLAGVAYALTGAARQPNVPAQTAQELERSATGVRSGVKALRSLLIEIYPPNLAEIGLGSALTDLVARAELRDLTATLDTAELARAAPGPDRRAALPVRAGSPAERVRHSGARSVRGRPGRHRPDPGRARGAGRRRRFRRRDRRFARLHRPLRVAGGRGPRRGGRRELRGSFVARQRHGAARGGTAAMIRVLIVDDHAVVRRGLEQLIASAADLEAVGTAADGEEAVRLAAETPPDVILMDLSMPLLDGGRRPAASSPRSPTCTWWC